MRAATIRDGEVVVAEHPDPEPGKGEVLVRVRAAGLNGADMLQRQGAYPAPPGSPPDIPGLELAGEVAARGPGAERFAEGDRVMGIVGGGGQAELATVHERQLMPVPEALDWPQAGGAPEVFTTAHDALFTQAGLRTGERLLVHGGGRGRRDGGRPARPGRGRARDRHRAPRGAARGGRGARRRGDRSRGLRRARPVRRDPRARRRAQHAREPQGARHRRADRGHRRGRRAPRRRSTCSR